MFKLTYGVDDCSGAVLAPHSDKLIQTAIDEIIRQVRVACGNHPFEACQRYDDAWVFIPDIATRRHRNLCTVWARKSALHFNVTSQEDWKGGKRRFPEDGGPALLERLKIRHREMYAAWAAHPQS